MKPVIVVVAYNRVKSIRRLLTSLEIAKYGEFDGQIKLIISIDYSGSDKVLKEVKQFKWTHGDLQIIEHKENLGLRKHILKCGDLVTLHDSIILLEDDLFVAPSFYKYAVSALTYYEEDESVGGISLYSHLYNESAGLRFIPMEDDCDIYFLQITSSWGQAWSKSQWVDFRNWYDEGQVVSKEDCLPNDVILWPDSSWKKFFIKYLVQKNKYFVYPKISFSTNFGDAGTHQTDNNLYQVPLFMGKKNLSFKKINQSISVYDSFCELLPSVYKKLNADLKNYDFESDLYGVKEINKINSDFILTSRKSKFGTVIKSFDLKMKPMELNIKYNIDGNFFNLIKLRKNEKLVFNALTKIKIYEYFYKPLNRSSLKLLFQKLIIKIYRKFY